MREIMQHEQVRARGKEAVDTVKNCTTHYHRLSSELVDRIVANKPDELETFIEAQKFLETEFNLKFTLVTADECVHDKAGYALPFKPAIIIE